MITNLIDLTTEIREHLTTYLELLGHPLSSGGKICCLNPDHKERSPSMHITPDGKHVKCFGCQVHWSVIDLHCALNGLETTGEDLRLAATQIAKMLNIDCQLKPLTPEEMFQLELYEVYDKVEALISDPKIEPEAYTPSVKQYLKEHKWTVDTCKTLGIGSITGLSIEQLVPEDADDSKAWLYKRDLRRPDDSPQMFTEDRLIFTFHDEGGRVRGFTARDTSWSKETGGSKYLNTRGTNTSIFSKGDLLYNYHRARKFIREKSKEKLYVFEGQPDVVTAWQNQIGNCVAASTSHISERQIQLLRRSGATKIILCFDNDDSGIKGMLSLIEHNLNKFTGVKVFVLSIPDSMDPDEFIRANGVEEFHKLKPVLAFDWWLDSKKNKNVAPEDLARLAVPLISSFVSAIERESLCKKLSLFTDITTQTLLEEVNLIVYAKENNTKGKIQEIGEDLIHQLKKNPNNALSILEDARTKIQIIESSSQTDQFGGDFFAEQMLKHREEAEAFTSDFPGYKLPLMGQFQDAFNNDWSSGKAIYFGGSENSGKSSLANFLMYNLAMEEADNNVISLYMTIDDALSELYQKLICIAGKHMTMGYEDYANGFNLNINHVTRPRYWANILDDIGMGEAMSYAYKIGYDRIMQMARQERFVMLGIPTVNNLKDFRRALERLRRRHPDRKIVGFLDNVHKLPLSNGDARIAFKEISNEMKNMAVELGITVAGTLEYNSDSAKRGKENRPTNSSLAESRAFKYDANALVHVYNNLHEMGTDSIFYHEDASPWNKQIKRLPIVEAIIGKNKISDDKMPHFFKFYPGSSWFEYLDRGEAVRLAKLNEQIQKEGPPVTENPDSWGRVDYIEQ